MLDQTNTVFILMILS